MQKSILNKHTVLNKIIYILLILFLSVFQMIAQDEDQDTSAVVNAWTLSGNYLETLPYEVDTLLYFFQLQNPVYKISRSNAYLGNFGSSAVSNILTKRWDEHELLFITPYLPYMSRAFNTVYFNTKKPFTRLSYTSAGPRKNREETLEVLHTQNITPFFNAGIKYNLISAHGQYAYQKVQDHGFKFFTSYTGRPYSIHANFNINKLTVQENGGVVDDRFVSDTTFDMTRNIPVNFGGSGSSTPEPDARTTVRNINLMLVQQLDFSLLGQSSDSVIVLSTDKKFRPSIVHAFQFERIARIYDHIDQTPNDEDSFSALDYYRNIYINPNMTKDSLFLQKIHNSLKIDLKGVLGNQRVGGFSAGASQEMLWYGFHTPGDTSFNYQTDTTGLKEFFTPYLQNGGDTLFDVDFTKYLTDIYFTSEIYGVVGDQVNARAYGRFYPAGYKAGNYMLGVDFNKRFGSAGKGFRLTLKGKQQNDKPNYLLDNYYSNHFIWKKNNFRNIHSNHLSAGIEVLPFAFEGKFHYNLIKNHVYFDCLALPQQTTAPVNVLTIEASKVFKFWWVTSHNKLYYQHSTNPAVLPLPEFVYFNSTYIDKLIKFKLTGGQIRVLLGFDLYYNTAFYAPAYMPATGTFYNQQEKKLGNYPYIDVFLNLRLKRTRFFVKMEHVNYMLNPPEYYTVLNYPMNIRVFKWGLSWTFYD